MQHGAPHAPVQRGRNRLQVVSTPSRMPLRQSLQPTMHNAAALNMQLRLQPHRSCTRPAAAWRSPPRRGAPPRRGGLAAPQQLQLRHGVAVHVFDNIKNLLGMKPGPGDGESSDSDGAAMMPIDAEGQTGMAADGGAFGELVSPPSTWCIRACCCR